MCAFIAVRFSVLCIWSCYFCTSAPLSVRFNSLCFVLFCLVISSIDCNHAACDVFVWLIWLGKRSVVITFTLLSIFQFRCHDIEWVCGVCVRCMCYQVQVQKWQWKRYTFDWKTDDYVNNDANFSFTPHFVFVLIHSVAGFLAHSRAARDHIRASNMVNAWMLRIKASTNVCVWVFGPGFVSDDRPIERMYVGECVCWVWFFCMLC